MTAPDRRFFALLAALCLVLWVPRSTGEVLAEEDEGADEASEAEKPKEEAGEKGAAEKGTKSKKKKAAKKKAVEKFDLEAWGQIKEVKGSDFFSLTYSTKANGKKPAKVTSFIKVGDSAAFYQDKPLNVTDLKEGDAIWLLGRPVEQETGAAGGGLLSVDRQIQNVTAIAGGEALRVNRDFKDPRDDKVMWCEAVVEKTGQPLFVKYQENSFKVTLGRLAGILHREKVEATPLKNGLYVEFAAQKAPDRPETKNASDAKKEAYAAKKVVLLDRRLLPIYAMLME